MRRSQRKTARRWIYTREMGGGLESIVAATRERVEKLRHAADRDELRRRAGRHKPRGFARALRAAYERDGFAIIAELKKASPSKGVIRGSFAVAGLAVELQKAGASALSVLTEEKFFQGSLANLCEASAATDLPCLRKDFIVDEFQVLEARANRADAILLIVAALSRRELMSLADVAHELGLDVLCEIHDEDELESAMAARCDMIGVNSRNLKTLEIDNAVPRRLAGLLPKTLLRVAESGIASGTEIRELADLRYQAFLIGESLMRADSPGEALAGMISEFRALSTAERRGA